MSFANYILSFVLFFPCVSVKAKAFSIQRPFFCTVETDTIKTSLIRLRQLKKISSKTIYFTDDIGKEGFWKYDLTDSVSADNEGLIILNGEKRIKRLFDSTILASWFGAKGDGNSDNTKEVENAIYYSRGRTLIFPGGHYVFKKKIVTNLYNNIIIGTLNKTVFSGNSGNALIELLDVDNSTIQNISFQSMYKSDTLDKGSGVVYSYQKSIHNFKIENCTFKAPYSNTQGLVFFSNISWPITRNSIKGLQILSCIFDSIGAIGCTIMNRTISINGYYLADSIKFNNNIGMNLGLKGNYGFLISFDGIGENFECNDNSISNALGIGIENNGWKKGEFLRNTFSGFKRKYSPFSFSVFQVDSINVSYNRTIGFSLGRCTFANVSNSFFSNNYFASTDIPGVVIRNGDNNRFSQETYIGRDYALLIGNEVVQTKNNTFQNCLFETVISNSSVVRFIGTQTTENIFIGSKLLKSSGGVISDQIFGAYGNIIN